MDMQHGRFAPGLLAAVTGATLFGTYVAFTGFDADIGHSATLLVLAIGVFVAPGCVGALCMDIRARRARPASPMPASVFAAADITLPSPAAEAVADIRSLTEARVARDRRPAHPKHAVTAG
jgi:hypothetical protein